jgi:hypothetical protein
MALRNGHGRGAGQPRVEVLPPDELPAGIAATQPQGGALPRPPYAVGLPAAAIAGARGGHAKAGSTRLARRLGIAELPEGAPFAPYKRAASAFRRFHVARLAASVGGGQCGPAPASIVATSAWQLASSRYLFDLVASGELGPDALKLASQLGNDSRQNLLAAHELCAREAKSRPKSADEVPAWVKHMAAVDAKCAADEANESEAE